MKILARLVIALAVCLIAIPLIATPVQAVEMETITVWPSSGHPGEEIHVIGTHFEGDEEAEIYYNLIPGTGSTDYEKVGEDDIDSEGNFSVHFDVPDSAKGDHRVRAKVDGVWSVSAYFEVIPGLELDPEEGAVGEEVSVTGTGFAEDEEDIEIRFYVDGSDYEKVADNITADEYGSWDETFYVPACDKGDHRVDARGDDSELSDVEDATFEVLPGLSLSKSSGHVGDTVTVTGSGFGSKEKGVKVTYDDDQVGASTTADSDGTWTISFEVPASTKGSHDIDAYGNSTHASDIDDKTFTVSPNVVLSPSNGHVGTDLSISGTGFAASKSMTIFYDDVQQDTSTTDSNGSFPAVSFTVPAGIHGNHPVKATDGSANTATANFVMESTPPPLPTLVSPQEGARVGLVGSVAPTFQWQVVIDDSGIGHYTLEIASDEVFTAEAMLFTHDIIETEWTLDTASNTASYTLPGENALASGTYYWRLQAVDKAQNDSGWAVAQSFHSGLLPLWAFITAIALAAVLIGALVYLLVVRRRGYYD